jgi:hypothetical protein
VPAVARSDAAGAALNLATALKPHTKLIVSAGYDRNFLHDLRADARALREAMDFTSKVRQQRSRATHIIASELKKCTGTLMGRTSTTGRLRGGQSVYARAADKRAAVRELFLLQDPKRSSVRC